MHSIKHSAYVIVYFFVFNDVTYTVGYLKIVRVTSHI